MKSVIVQQIYPKLGYLTLAQEMFSRNTNYCERIGSDYVFHSSQLFTEYGAWDKIYRMIELSKRYDLVMWLDVDAIIFDTNRDIQEVPLPEDSIGAVRFNTPMSHLNVGVLYLKPGERTEKFMDTWLASRPGRGAWVEQTEFNAMRHNPCVVELPLEWNRNYDRIPGANPVVMGFHGMGSAENRRDLMRKVLDGRHT